jgi:hypothetical protein
MLYNPALFLCTNKMAQGLSMMMDPLSDSFQQLWWSSPATIHRF